jgi:arylsulfatase A-like enzyme
MKPLILALLLAIPALAAKPNILFILADELGYGDLSCYGQTHFQTPAIDNLAAGGIRFAQHYSGSTVCAPARASLMTGKDTGHTAIRGNDSFELPATETTVATRLRQAGYNTALIGKSCVTGNTQTPETLARHGIDYFYGTTDRRDGHFRYPTFVYENAGRVEFPDNKLHTGSHCDLDLYTDKALGYLDKQSAEKPFFLLLSIPVPHASINLPEESIPAKPVKHPHYTRVADPEKSYAGLMTRIDKTVGAVTAKLREK